MSARRTIAAYLCAAWVLGAAVPASADSVLFSNLSTEGFDRNFGLSFGFNEGQEGGPDYYFSQSSLFVPVATGLLRTLEIPLFYTRDSSDTGVLQVNLFDSEDGLLPGSLLETFTYASLYSSSEPLVLQSVLTPLLVAGRTYFLEPTTTGRGTGAWFISLEDPTAYHAVFRTNNGAFMRSATPIASAGAMQLTGDVAPVPEPATLTLLGTGLAAAFLRARRRRRPDVV